MVIASNEVAMQYNLAAAAACWTMLAGFFILPGTFTALKRSTLLASSHDGAHFQSAVQNVPLLPIAGVCYSIAIGTIILLWFRFHRNYVWIQRYLLMLVSFAAFFVRP